MNTSPLMAAKKHWLPTLKRSLFLWGVIAAGGLMASAAGLTEETVEITGRGMSLPAAVNNALVEAVSQVNGVQIESSQVRAQLESVTVSGDDVKALSAEAFQSAIATATKGLVKRYEIVSHQATARGGAEVRVRAVVSRYDAGPATARKRIAVLPFRTGEGVYRVGEQTGGAARLEKQLNRLITDNLVQTRRFSIIDREFTQEIQAERQRLLRPDINPEERARLGQEMGADYVLAGSLDEFQLVAEKGVFRASGREYQRLVASTKLSYRIIELATGQTVLADNLQVPPGPLFGAGSLPDAQAESYLMNWLADRIGTRITWTIYPVKVVTVLADGEIVLNQGGSAFRTGDRLEVFNLGQRLMDPYTKESIGYEETLAGTLEVSRVLPKAAYARLISTIHPVAVGAICRPAAPTEAAAQPEVEPTTLDKSKSEIDNLFK